MASLTPTLPAASAGAGLVVDAGFSFTHIVPFFEGNAIMQVSGSVLGLRVTCAALLKPADVQVRCLEVLPRALLVGLCSKGSISLSSRVMP